MRLRRPAAPAVVAVLALVAGGCGAAGDGAAVERLIEDDWNAAEAGGARWPGRPDLDGTRVEAVRCPEQIEAGSVVCTVRLARGGPATDVDVDVIADVDAAGAIRRWRLEG